MTTSSFCGGFAFGPGGDNCGSAWPGVCSASSTSASVDLGGELLDLELGDIGGLEIRHQIDRDGELQIGLAVHHLLHIAHRLDARLSAGFS